MGIHKLFAILVAVAVLFAPALMRAGEAHAATPDHAAQMMEAGHCKAPPSHPGNHDSDKSKHKSCCLSMCAAAAIAAPAAATLDDFVPKSTYNLPPPADYRGYLGEIATPPPRLA
jgi:hypothetical protein